MKNCESIEKCIACGHDELEFVLDLGKQPLANSFKKTAKQEEEYFPLAINHCAKCHHVQLSHIVNPDLLFKDYLYVSGTSKTQLDYFEWLSNWIIEQHKNTPQTVLDIGCNDGSLLDVFKRKDIKTFGVDPAENLYEISSKNHNVICGYFNDQTYDSENTNFDIITCLNAFAHNYNPLQFLENVKLVMGNNSRLYISTSQADMILNNEFDTIYHEHISFYNIKSMNALCERAGLNLIDVIKHPIHGNSYLFVISRYENRPSHIQNLINFEANAGLYSDETYVEYSNKCNNILQDLHSEIQQLKDSGYTVIGLGAPAKGNTLLNAADVSLNFIIDENPMKQGLFTPGKSIPVHSMDVLEQYANVKTFVFVPLAWNFFNEISAKITKLRPNKKDIFVRYFPEVKRETF